MINDGPGPSQIPLDSEAAMPLYQTKLNEMFPQLSKPAVDLIYRLTNYDYAVAVNCLLDLSAERILSLMQQLNMTGPPMKLRVDESSIFEDALAFYKVTKFDPTRPLRGYLWSISQHWIPEGSGDNFLMMFLIISHLKTLMRCLLVKLTDCAPTIALTCYPSLKCWGP